MERGRGDLQVAGGISMDCPALTKHAPPRIPRSAHA